MFDKKYEQRLRIWNSFRASLETSADPIGDVVNFYKHAPLVSIQMDPWDSSTWLDPWELILENQYCEFSKILAICYTLQLTDKFSQAHYEIHIIQDKENFQKKYLLFIDNICIGYDDLKPVFVSNLPSTIEIEMTYTVELLI
jgi:hypothetical protein